MSMLKHNGVIQIHIFSLALKRIGDFLPGDSMPDPWQTHYSSAVEVVELSSRSLMLQQSVSANFWLAFR